jgi:hypothetical protein
METILSLSVIIFGVVLFFGIDYLFDSSLFKELEELERIITL